ncbi:rhodanese-like domain-containing protein [bacterium]|jgi:rhodanese-related sulfurtransferase|nr:rhodanese-like domain-containing protein [bacterium]
MKPNWEITAEELQNCLQSITLVDVREPEEHEAMAIPGGKLIPLGELSIRATQELNPDDEIVLYCAHGVRSLYAVRILQSLGFTRMKSLQGGIEHWLTANGTIETTHSSSS